MTRNHSLASPQSVNGAVKSICDIMRRSNCAGALQYVPELTWILFLRILDEREQREAEEADAVAAEFTPSLEAPYRWRDWAAPEGAKRKELQNATLGAFFGFVHGVVREDGTVDGLLPYLKGLRDKPGATPRQKVISEIMSGVERVRVDTERNFCDILDKVHEITAEAVDPTHVFTLSQVYEGLLLKMGEKGSDAGQFFTPREVIRVMVRAVAPKAGETVYDPCCGTGGFLAQAFEHILGSLGDTAGASDLEALKRRTFFGREKDNQVYPIALANLILHGFDEPSIWHGNTLTGQEVYGGLFLSAPPLFDVILTNPPFGGKEGKEAQTRFAYKTRATQILFLQHIIDSLAPAGRCGMVLDEGALFRTSQKAFVQTKRKLLDECDLWCIITLPGGVFTQAGAGVKTNLLFFTKGGPTERIWYYDLSDLRVTKKSPLTADKFGGFFRLLPSRPESGLSWTVNIQERKQRAAEEAEPFKTQARAKERQALDAKQQLSALKRAKPRDEAAIAELEERLAELRRDARELTGRADEIESAVYDLKAINPNKKLDEDTRTPEQLLDLIEAKGRDVAEAIAALRRMGAT